MSKSVKDTRFLLALNKEERDLYILHREYPRCLIYVEPTTPVNFVVFDLFEPVEETEEITEILTSNEFKQDLKKFFFAQSFNFEDLN